MLETILAFGAEVFIEGHNETVMTRADLLSMLEKMRFAGELAQQFGGNEEAVFAAAKAKLGQLDEDTAYFLHTFMVGKNLPTTNSETL